MHDPQRCCLRSNFAASVGIQKTHPLIAEKMLHGADGLQRRLVRKGIARQKFGAHVIDCEANTTIIAHGRIVVTPVEHNVVARHDITELDCIIGPPRLVRNARGGATQSSTGTRRAVWVLGEMRHEVLHGHGFSPEVTPSGRGSLIIHNRPLNPNRTRPLNQSYPPHQHNLSTMWLYSSLS